ncbi:MAG: hypothetical protein IT193_03385 [Propionibacteriaceae bacterium]|nr:hypothetical protein [Propionibacteriaceae bacterium]
MTTTIEAAERGRRELLSTVKRLRVSATSDPARGDELADALVRLTGSRLLAWGFSEAATDAPEAVVLAARILARNGAAGPYTSPGDAARFFTASALLAAVQSGLGQDEAAARTLEGVDGWLQQLGRLRLQDHLDPTAVIWSLLARSRSLLTTDVPRANAIADAAAHRLYAAGLESGTGYLPVAVQLLLADCRWAAGQAEPALAHHRLALSAHHAAIGPAATGRVRPAVAQVIEAPVVALHEPYALRLESLGESDLATAVRRREVELLERLAVAAASGRLAVARSGLAHTLARAGRGEEAAAELAEATALATSAGIRLPPAAPLAGPGDRCSWSALPAAQALTPDDLPAAAVTRLQQDLQAAVFDGVAARIEAQRTEAGLRAAAEWAAAARAAERAEAERLARAEAAAARAAAADQDRQAAEQAAARRQAEEAAARAAADRRRRRLAEEHQRQREIDPAAAAAAAAELVAARAAVDAAGDDLDQQRRAREHLAGLLRPLALVDADAHLPELVSTLESLVGLRWRSGDPEGSKEAAREARALGAETGR